MDMQAMGKCQIIRDPISRTLRVALVYVGEGGKV